MSEMMTRAVVAPDEDAFGGHDYLDAPELASLAGELIDEYEEIGWLSTWEIRYLWKRAGGSRNGTLTLGQTSKPGGLSGYLLGQATWVIWLAADHLVEANPREIEAVLYHELLHPSYDVDEKTAIIKPTMRGHDWEGFNQEIERYGLGARAASTRRLAETMKQLKLPGLGPGLEAS